MPFWVSVILALAGMIYFNVFFEAIILFILSDLLYGTKESSFPVVFTSFIVTSIVLIMIEIMKKKVKFYNDR